MQPDVPLQINRDAFFDALEALGIPIRGHHLMRLEADPAGITLTYKRVSGHGDAVVTRERQIATVRIDLGLEPVSVFAVDGE